MLSAAILHTYLLLVKMISGEPDVFAYLPVIDNQINRTKRPIKKKTKKKNQVGYAFMRRSVRAAVIIRREELVAVTWQVI